MTTIAFKDGIFAADSMAIDDDFSVISTNCQKLQVFEDTGGVYAGAGNADDRKLLEALCEVSHADEMPTSDELSIMHFEVSGLFWVPMSMTGKPQLWLIEIIQNDEDKEWYGSAFHIRNSSYAAVGSGKQFAMGAMANGASAEGALMVARTLDNMTGGDIQTHYVG